MGVEDDALLRPRLASVLQTMLDPVALYSRATISTAQGAPPAMEHLQRRPQGTGLEHGKEVAYECWSCSTASWCN